MSCVVAYAEVGFGVKEIPKLNLDTDWTTELLEFIVLPAP